MVACLFIQDGNSALRGYHDHIHKEIWEPIVGDKLVAQREFCNQFVIKVLNGKVRPRKYSRMAWNFSLVEAGDRLLLF